MSIHLPNKLDRSKGREVIGPMMNSNEKIISIKRNKISLELIKKDYTIILNGPIITLMEVVRLTEIENYVPLQKE